MNNFGYYRKRHGILAYNAIIIANCGLNGYVEILKIVLDILDKLIQDFQNICGCLTMNEMHIKLTSLIICLINDNLINTSSTPPPEGEKNSTVYSTFNSFVHLKRSFHLLEV